MNEEQEIEFKKITDVVIKYMNDNPLIFNPYHQLVFDTISVTITAPCKQVINFQFLHD